MKTYFIILVICVGWSFMGGMKYSEYQNSKIHYSDTVITTIHDTIIIRDTVKIQNTIKKTVIMYKTDTITGLQDTFNCYPIKEKFKKGEVTGSICSKYIPSDDTTAKLDLNLFLYPDTIRYKTDSVIIYKQPIKKYFWEGTAIGAVSVALLIGALNYDK